MSKVLRKITGSATSATFAKAMALEATGKDVVHFEIGQPDFLPIDQILSATVAAVQEGRVKYTISKGIIELRKAIAAYYDSFLIDSVDYESEVVVTAGGKLAVYAAVQSMTNPGDNVVIFNPSWVSYGDIVTAAGAEPRFIAMGTKFSFNEADLRAKINCRTRAIIVNTPNNPTGAILSLEGWQLLHDLAVEHDLLLISDEVYNEYVYDNNEFVSLGAVANWKEHGIIVNGLSKTFSMTGYRIGYSLTNAKLSNEINKIMQLTASCAPSFAQYAGVTAFSNIAQMRVRLQKLMQPRRKFIIRELATIPGISFTAPQGAMYAWIKLKNESDSVRWTDTLLESEGVAVMPGVAFGPDGEGYVRLSFAREQTIIQEGLKRIRRFMVQR